jgi:uncharacterized OsmC-like protein
MDCPYTGKGEELSPGELLEAALAGCMLISMGPTAERNGIDLRGVTISVDFASTPPPKIVYSNIKVEVNMPKGLSKSQAHQAGARSRHLPDQAQLSGRDFSFGDLSLS